MSITRPAAADPTENTINAGIGFGLPTNGTANAATALTAAFAAGASTGRDVEIPAGTYKVNSGLTHNIAKHSVRGAGNVFFDCSAMTTGTALTIIGAQGATGVGAGLNPAQHVFSGVTLTGPDTDAATVDGILVSDTSAVPMVALRGVRALRFRDNLRFGDNVWLAKFYDCVFGNAHRYGIDLTTGTNAGECISFYGCVVHNTHNAGNTGIGVHAAGNPDTYFYGCSFDYNDIEIHHKGGKLDISGGHLENGKAASGAYVGNPMVKLTRLAGQGRTMLAMTGVEISPTEGVTTPGAARSHLIENTSDSGDHVYLTCTACVFDTYDGNHTVFRNLATGTAPRVWFRGGMFDNRSSDSTRAATLGTYSNLVVNGDMEASATFEASAAAPFYPGLQWKRDGGGAAFAMDTTNQRSGTRCISAIGAPGNAASTSVKTAVSVRPGELLSFSGWVKISAYTSGTLAFRVAWYLDDYTTRTVIAFQKNHTAVQDWTPAAGALIVPPGIRVALIDLQSAAFVGTAYLDDVTAHLT